MEILFLSLVFLTIVLLLFFHRPLYQAILGGIIVLIVLYRIDLTHVFSRTLSVFTQWDSCQILLSLYLITFLQRMLENRNQIKLAQQDLNNLFHNQRINASIAPLFIGLLPSAAAMMLCGEIVKEASEHHLTAKEQAFAASWFRHIPESVLPTYASVLLMANLSQVPLPQFMLGMIIPVCFLFFIGYMTVLKKIPASQKTKNSEKIKDLYSLFQHLWSLLAIILLILFFKLSVVTSVILVLLLCCIVYKFKFREIQPLFLHAFEKKLMLNTFLVLVLKELISYTGALNLLPQMLSNLPIPSYLIFVLLFLAGGIISGSSGIIALGTPLAFASINGGMPLMVLLMCITHAASLISPTHICLIVTAEYFQISLGDLIKQTLPKAMIFCLGAILYYNLLILIL